MGHLSFFFLGQLCEREARPPARSPLEGGCEDLGLACGAGIYSRKIRMGGGEGKGNGRGGALPLKERCRGGKGRRVCGADPRPP